MCNAYRYRVKTFTDLTKIGVRPLPSATMLSNKRNQWAVQASFGVSAGVDTLIAAAMCYYLQKSRSGFSQ